MFISSYHERGRDKVLVWEKTESGKRNLREYDSPYNFYVPDEEGTFKAITGEKLKLLEFSSRSEFDAGCRSHPKRFESDLHPQEKVMMSYFGKKIPVVSVGFLDIEVDYDPAIGWPRASNPYAPINAITVYNTAVKAYFTLALPPETWINNAKEAGIPISALLPQDMHDDNYWLFNSERELLQTFIDLIQDIDILSGWNSEFFDMPYIAKRIELLFGKHALRHLAFEGGPTPRWGEKFRFKGSKEKEIVIDLLSRVHLDYMGLFKKFTLGGRQSFSLAAITEEELDVPKLHYEGTLYELYRNDFIHFLKYNRHDVTCILDLDKKFKYIQLANTMVHEATVNFSAIFGSVQLIDTAIINFSHSIRNEIVFDKTHKPSSYVEGALVMTPKIGLHKMIGSIDLASLYPSTYRTLNLSPEKIVGQLEEYEEGWKRVYYANLHPEDEEAQNATVTIIPEGTNPLDEDGEPVDAGLQITAGNMINFLKDNKYALTAYGTILDQGNGEGLIPAVLTYWFNGRKELQGLKKKHAKMAAERLEVCGDKTDPEYIRLSDLSEYYDMLQGVRKVLLNSTYGATLNEFCRFHDPRLGASTTGSGRQITTHMINTVAVNLMGEGAPKLVKTVTKAKQTKNSKREFENAYTLDVPHGIGPIYSDTDSCYFVMEQLVKDNVEDAIQCADAIAAAVNESFAPFVREAFFCQPGFDTLIKANREIVASAGIFSAKKKYILLAKDIEGVKIDVDDKKALKSQGSDIKISSTPEAIRTMLKKVLLDVLTEKPKKKINDEIIEFRRNFNKDDVKPLDYATTTSVKNLEDYYEKWLRIEKPGFGNAKLPGNVRPAINHNLCIEMFGDQNTRQIISGSKIKIVWLKKNEHDFKSMAFDSDTEELPKWFTDNFEIDVRLTELKLIDKKISNIFEPIGWEVPTEHTVVVNKLLNFDEE